MQDYLNQDYGSDDYEFHNEEVVKHITNPNQLLFIISRRITDHSVILYTCKWMSPLGEYREDIFRESELMHN
jgi:hypothetical protein